MYNRYVPQADGSYQRNRMQEPRQSVKGPVPPPPRPSPDPPCPPPEAHREPVQKPVSPPSHSKPGGGISDFFRHLLPKQLEMADLLILMLLLLMAGDCEEDKNNALLTMALYFLL